MLVVGRWKVARDEVVRFVDSFEAEMECEGKWVAVAVYSGKVVGVAVGDAIAPSEGYNCIVECLEVRTEGWVAALRA